MKVPEKVLKMAKAKAAYLVCQGAAAGGDMVLVKSGREWLFLNVAGPGSESLTTGRLLSDGEVFTLTWSRAILTGGSVRVDI